MALPAQLHALGLREVVLSPGSRNGPLILAFRQHPGIQVHSVPDERVAGFVAVGLAQTLGRPVALCCTSGSAGLNYGPALAEAFFRRIPLVVLTADRPPEWIGQWDGQTIYQQGMYAAHVKRSVQLPDDFTKPDASTTFQQEVVTSLELATTAPCGPVHLNIPLREPFYPAALPEVASFPARLTTTSAPDLAAAEWQRLQKELDGHERILLIAGQQVPQVIDLTNWNAPLLADIASNQLDQPKAIRADDALFPADAALAPDLLITFGGPVLGKRMKQWLRANPPKAHWHVGDCETEVPDPFESLTDSFFVPAPRFFERLSFAKPAFAQKWQLHAGVVADRLDTFFRQALDFGPLSATHQLLRHLPSGSTLHLGNSMAIRYASLVGPPAGIRVEANRGTSGIDGCLSTAVGSVLAAPDRLHISLLGDLSFFYDRNALWQERLPEILRVVVLNDNGGGIFRLIDGPSRFPEHLDGFTTPHHLTCERTAADHGLRYLRAESAAQLGELLPEFLVLGGGPALMELPSDPTTDTATWRSLLSTLRPHQSS